MTSAAVVAALEANYFSTASFRVRKGTGTSGFPWILVLVLEANVASRLFGLRFVDYPLAPPTLRFWAPARWEDSGFSFDFTTNGDAGTGTSQTPAGVPTMCIPYHADFYLNGWHAEHLWASENADEQVADLVVNILRRA